MMTSEESLTTAFAGDLLLRLAAEGRLVLDARQADALIAGLEETLARVQGRRALLADGPLRAASDPVEVAAAEFAEAMAPGRLDDAAVELPKYIAAVRRARCCGTREGCLKQR